MTTRSTSRYIERLSTALRVLDGILREMGAGGLRGVLLPTGGRRVVEGVCGAELLDLQKVLAGYTADLRGVSVPALCFRDPPASAKGDVTRIVGVEVRDE